MHGKGGNRYNKTKELKQIKQALADNVLKKPPLHKDYHKYMKRKHYQKAIPYSRALEKEEPPLPKSRDINQFQTDVTSYPVAGADEQQKQRFQEEDDELQQQLETNIE